MKKPGTAPGNAAALRKKAEKKLSTQLERPQKPSARGTRDLVHELGTHQIELEMQNEELRKTQEELEASRNRYADLFDFAPVGYLTFDKAGVIREVNLTAANLLGIERRSLVKKPFSAFVSKDDRDAFRRHCSEVSEERTKQSIEIRLKRWKGTDFFALLESIAVEDPDGKAVTVRTAISDITGRTRAEKALQESELRYRSLFENMLDGYAYCRVMYDKSGRPVDFVYLSVNSAFERLTGLKDVVGMRVTDVIPGIRESHPELLETYGRVAATGRTEKFETEFKPLGMWLSISVYSTERDHFTAVFDNITERKNAAQTLGRSEEKYRLLFENMAEGFALYELLYDDHGKPVDWRVLEVNDAYSVHTGIPREQIEGRCMSDVSPEAIPEYLPRFAAVVANQKSVEFETYAKFTRRYHHILSFPAGSNRFANTITDITERTLSEKALRDHELKASALINAADESIWLFGLQGDILAANATAARRLGMHVDEVVGKKWQNLIAPALAASRKKKVEDVVRTGGPVRFEDERAGMIFDHTVYPVRDDTGKITAVAFFSRDITERKRIEERTAHLASFPQLNPNPILEVDASGRITFFNPAMVKTLKALGMDEANVVAFFPPDMKDILESWDRSREKTLYREIVIKERVFGAVILLAPQFNVARIYAYDITERKHAEDVLRQRTEEKELAREAAENEKRLLAAVMEALPVGVAITDAQGGNVRSNRGYDLIWGGPRPATRSVEDYTAYQAWWADTGKPVQPGEWASAIAVQRGEIVSGQVMRIRRFDGSEAYVINSASPVRDAEGKIVGCAVSVQDITALKLAEESLRKSERLYRAIGESIDFGIWICDPEGRNIYASDSFLKLVGLTQEQCSSFGWGEVLHPDDAERTIAAWKECVRTGGNWDIEHRFRGVDGQWYPVLARGVPVRDEQGAVQYWAGINLDIRQIKSAEQALRESEERLRFHAENSPLAVIEWDTNFIVTRWSGEAERIFGWSAAETVGRPILDLKMIYEEDAPIVEETVKKLTDGVSRKVASANRNYTKYGQVIHCEWYNSVLQDDTGKMSSVMSQVLDVTARKQAEKALLLLNEELEQRVTERTSELRNLQAHVEAVREGERAHIAREVHDQLGQAMTALKMDIAWLKRNHPSGNSAVRERTTEMLGLINGAIDSVKRITSELRPSVLDDFGMQAAIEWAAKEFEKRSGVTCRVLSRPASITMDRTRSTVIYRVLQESLTNVARHAKATNVVVSLDLEGERFRMTVQDDGKGIPARKAGDPSSYGLMGMRERVGFLGGDFSISGGKGRGTTLMVSIPLSGTRQSTGGAFPAGSPAPSDEQPPDGVQESGKEARP